MPRTLCLDFGNTRLKWAILVNGEITETGVLKNEVTGEVLQILELYKPDRSILSSVVNHPPELDTILEKRTRFHVLNHLSKIPITTPVGKPETIGADRLALVVAASHDYPDKNNLIIGLGSAITYNFINRNRQFLGGGISPGMEMRFKSLHEFTAKLPLVKPHWNFSLIGHDTKTNIQSGVILGMAKEIDGMIDAYEEKFLHLNVLMTGGDAQHIRKYLKKNIQEDPDLIFKGLYVISEFNFNQ